LHEGDGASGGGGEGSDAGHDLGDLLMVGVGEVEAEEVDAGVDEARDELIRGDGGSPGGDDLGELVGRA